MYTLIAVGIILGYTFLGYYYYRGVLSLNQFLAVSIVTLLSVSSLTLLFKHPQREAMVLGANLKWVVYVLPYVAFIFSTVDAHLHGHLDILSVVSLVLVFIMLALSRRDLDAALFGATTLGVIIAVLYGIYSPSFGNDTWRDAIKAMQIVERGGLRNLTIVEEVYPFPLVSLLYAVYSIVVGINTLWSSSIVGILYLLLLILWIHVLSNKLNTGYHRVASLLALSAPLVIVWSVWFIPQAYALLMALPLLFLKLPLLIVVVLIIAMVLGHVGMALLILGIFLVLIISIKTLNIKASGHIDLQQFSTKLVLFFIVFSVYATYTLILMVLKGAITSVFEAIITFLAGEKIVAATTPIQSSFTSSILGFIPIAILTALGLVRMLEDNDIIIRLLALASLAGLAIAYVGAVAFPALGLPRYLGLGLVTLLAILSPQVFQSLTRRGKVGMGYAYALLLLAILSFGFAGTLMPENPYTGYSRSTWSISGLITYGEAQELDNIAFKLYCNNYLSDWRSGAYIGYKYLWIQPLSRGFYNPETQGFFAYAGSYGLLVTPEYLTSFKGVLIFRQSSLNMLEAYSPETDVFLNNMIDNVSMLYMSSRIRIILFK
jgi:hypothetical protein